MKIPKKLRICGQTIDVIQVKDLALDKQPALGGCDTNNCKIYIKKNMPNEKKKEVLLHECIHMFCENLNIRFGKNEKENENIVNTLGVHMLSLITVNKLDFLS